MDTTSGTNSAQAGKAGLATILFYCYILIIPLEYLVEKLPKGPTGINYQTLTMLLVMLWWIVSRSSRQKLIAIPLRLNSFIIGMLLWNAFGMLLAGLTVPGIPSLLDFFGDPFKRLLTFINATLLFFAAANMIESRQQVRMCVMALALASPLVFRSFYVQLQAVRGWHFSNDMRISGPFLWIGSNELGAFFAYSAVFFGLFAFQLRRTRERMLLLGSAAMYCYGILYSYSRATQLAFGLAISLVAVARYRIVLMIMIVMAFTSSMWLPYSVRERWEKTQDESGQLEESAESRKVFGRIGWEMFKENPVIGKGIGAFAVLNPYHMDTHNIYMRTLAESGVIGFFLFAGVWLCILGMSARLWRQGPTPFDRQYGFSLMIATVALMVTNGFGDRFTHYVMIGHYWILVGLGARLYAAMQGLEPLAEDLEATAERDTAARVKPMAGTAAGIRGWFLARQPRSVPKPGFARPALQLFRPAGATPVKRWFKTRSDFAAPPPKLNLVGRPGGSVAPRIVRRPPLEK